MPDTLQRTDAASPYAAFAAQARMRPDAVFLAAPASAELPYAPDGFRYTYGEGARHIEALRATYAAAGLMLLPLGAALLKTIRRKQFAVEKSNS